MDGRTSRYTTDVLDWYRHQDAEDLGRKTFNELVENMHLVLCEKSWRMEELIRKLTRALWWTSDNGTS